MVNIKFPTACKMVAVTDLQPYAKNPKEHTDKDIDLIIKSIKRNGWGDPILVCPETHEILSGNGRYWAAQKIGLPEVPVVYAPEGMSEKQKADLVIASNKLVEVSGYNDNLGDLIAEFDDWVRKLKYDVFISEYNTPFEKIASFNKLALLNNSKTTKNTVCENLYLHKAEKQQ